MSLHKLARELDETARQTAGMAEGVMQALEILGDSSVPAEEARHLAARVIVKALQAQDRIEQRCANMKRAVHEFAALPPGTPDHVYDAVWAGLVLDELRIPSLSGIARHDGHGKAELF